MCRVWRSLGRLSCILAVLVASTLRTAGAITDLTKTNCTVLEWNIGILGWFSEDFQKSGQNWYIPPIVFLDLDFQSTWNQSLQVDWGSPFWARSVDLNPCLRIRPLLVDTQDFATFNQMKAQVKSIWLYEDLGVDVLVYEAAVKQELVLHSGSIGKVSVGMLTESVYENKQAYPYLFRYSKSAGELARVMFRYFVHFTWRALVYMYDEADVIRGKFQIFLALWNAGNRSSDLMQIQNLPSEYPPYRRSTIHSILQIIRRGTVRLLVADLSDDYRFAADAYCQPYPFNGCVIVDMMNAGLWAPEFQLVVSDATEALKWTFFPFAWVYNSSLHYAGDIAGKRLFLWTSLPALFSNIARRMKSTVYVNAYTRYGMNKWENDNWKTKWESLFVQGQLYGGMMSHIYWFYGGWLSDVLAFVVFGLNHVMDKYQPSAKSEITLKMITDGMSVATPPWTAFGGTVAYTMPYPGQAASFGSAIYQDVWEPASLHNYLGYNQEPICCESIYPGLSFFGGLPRWSTGNVSKIPPPSLMNCTSGQFLLPSGLCEWCQPGRFSNTTDQTSCTLCQRGKKASAKAVACDPCDLGKAATELQMESCAACIPGTYAPIVGMSLCFHCEFGKYSSVRSSTFCQSCGGDLTTRSRASRTRSECVCQLGTFSKNIRMLNLSMGNVDAKCEVCMDGLDCKTNWPDNWNAIGNPISVSEPGYYTLKSSPYEPYKCCLGLNCEEDCPGGPPESCLGGRFGLVCDGCSKDGYFVSGKVCKECPKIAKFWIPISLVLSTLGCYVAYFLANGRLTVNADHPLAFFIFIGLVVTIAQIFGVVRNLSIPWPTFFERLMAGSSSVFALDADSVSIECSLGRSAIAVYLFQILLPYVLVVEMFFLLHASQLVAALLRRDSIAWEINRSLNVVGQLMQALFIAFCGIMVKPLQCFTHPNGKRSMVAYPRVLCGETGDHTFLMILAACVGMCFLLPFVAWCIWGCLKAPHESSINNFNFLVRYRFLLYRFRPDFWWWGLCFLLRQTVLAFATVVPSENPHAQLFYTGGTLAVYGFLVCRLWPWICKELSALDAISMLALLLLMLVASQFLPEPSPNKGRIGILVAMCSSLAALLVWYIALLIFSIRANGFHNEFDVFNPDRMSVCKLWLQWLEYSQNVQNSDIVEAVCRMSAFDRQALLNFMTRWMAATGLGVHSGRRHLQGLPAHRVLSTERVAHITQESSRTWSTQDLERPNPLNVHDEFERNSTLPRSLRIFASVGIRSSCGNAKSIDASPASKLPKSH